MSTVVEVKRRVHRRPRTLEDAVSEWGPLHLDAQGARLDLEPFHGDDDAPVASWRAPGVLHPAGLGLARFARVAVEVSARSDDECEVRVVPASHRLDRWSARRARRYFAAAHAAADSLSEVLASRS